MDEERMESFMQYFLSFLIEILVLYFTVSTTAILFVTNFILKPMLQIHLMKRFLILESNNFNYNMSTVWRGQASAIRMCYCRLTLTVSGMYIPAKI